MFCHKSIKKGFVTLQVIVILGLALLIMTILIDEAYRNIENETSIQKEITTSIEGGGFE